MNKQDVIDKAKALIAAPMTYAPLKAKAQAWLDAIGTPEEKTKAAELIAQAQEDVTAIDDLVAFATSAHAVEVFGAEGAKKFAAHAQELKAKGAKYCDCAACSPAVAIIESKSLIA